MILGQDVYHAIRPLEYFSANEKRSTVAVRLLIGWVLSGPLPSSSCLTSTCFKVNIEHDNELASQVKSWYDIESFGANKQVDSKSAVDARAHEMLESTTIHNGLRYDVGMLWAADNIHSQMITSPPLCNYNRSKNVWPRMKTSERSILAPSKKT